MVRKSKKKRELTKTEKDLRKYKAIHYSLKAAPFATVMVPFGVELGVNWNKWFPQGQNNTYVAIGLSMSVLSTILSVLAIAKKDSDFMKKVGPFVTLAIGFMMWGAVCVFLSSVLMELGLLLIYAGCSIIGASIEDVVDKAVVKPRYLKLKAVADENGLTKSGEWELEVEEQAKKDKKKLEFVPYD